MGWLATAVAGATIAACVGDVGGPSGQGAGGDGITPGASSGGNSSSGSGSGGASSGGVVTGPVGSLTATSPRGVRLLSAREYDNVVRDLLGDTTSPGTKYFSTQVYPNGYDNGSVGLAVDTASVADTYVQAAETVAKTAVTAQLPKLIGTCDSKADANACVQAFLTTFAPRAYRRPLTQQEQAGLQNLYMLGSDPATGLNGGGFLGGLELMLEGVLESPSFLYREELGGTPSNNLVQLTPFEVASELSFLLTGSTPDDQLFSAAQSGKLASASDYLGEATRLLQSDGAKGTLSAFLNEWMATTQVSTVSKSDTIYPNWAMNPALGTSMATELNQFYQDVLFGGGAGSIRDFFTSPKGFVDANLAPLYGVQAPAGGGMAMLDAQTRPGIFTRAGWLTLHSDADTSGPVARGTFIITNILCQTIPPPPMNVPPPPSAEAIAMKKTTTRLAFESVHLNGASLCVGCHTAIDGVGYTFEEFDGLGAYRTTENGLPIDDTGNIALQSDVDGPIAGKTGSALTGAAEVAQKLADSKEAVGCFTKQVYRYAMGQIEGAAAKPSLDAITSGDPTLNMQPFNSDSKMTQAFLSLIQEPAFVLRTTAQ